MIGIWTTPLRLLRRQVWLQAFPLLVCQISSCHATSVPALTICKHALVCKIQGDHAIPSSPWVAIHLRRSKALIPSKLQCPDLLPISFLLYYFSFVHVRLPPFIVLAHPQRVAPNT